jgi:hypothetical protein
VKTQGESEEQRQKRLFIEAKSQRERMQEFNRKLAFRALKYSVHANNHFR